MNKFSLFYPNLEDKQKIRSEIKTAMEEYKKDITILPPQEFNPNYLTSPLNERTSLYHTRNIRFGAF